MATFTKRETAKGKVRWLVRVFLGRDSDTGKQKFTSKTFDTKRGAESWARSKETQIDEGTFIEPTKMTLDGFLDDWLEVVRQRVRHTTFNDYEGLLRNHVRPVLGRKLLQKITPLMVQKVYTEMLEKNLSPRTVRYVHSVLHNALTSALQWGYISRNPCSNVDLPSQRQRTRSMRVLNAEQVKAFLEVASGDRWHAFFMLMLTTGMRPSEALGLRWEDLDLDGGQATVRQVVVGPDGDRRIEAPKTPQARRTIPLLPQTVQAIRERRRDQAEERLAAGPEWNDTGLIFTSAAGESVQYRNLVRRHFEPLLEQADLPHMRLYDLRHTHATLLLQQSVHPKVASERLGHASVSLTLDTYSHVLPSMQDQVQEKLAEILKY